MYQEIHEWANKLKRYSFSQLEELSDIKNGIYLCFESGEKIDDTDRIVRVGSHPTNGRFYQRLKDHFLEEHRSSIIRKHIGRCLLNQKKDSYLKVWDYTNKQVKNGSPLKEQLDLDKEKLIENRISAHLKAFSFVVIPHLNDASCRLELEAKLISTLNKGGIGCSPSWLGLSHPNEKIRKSGLWNIHHLFNKLNLTKVDFEFIQKVVN